MFKFTPNFFFNSLVLSISGRRQLRGKRDYSQRVFDGEIDRHGERHGPGQY